MPAAPAEGAPNVGLFVTCLVDLFRPSVGFASVQLLEDAGCRVEVPAMQTCCGQPAYNSGDNRHAKQLARQVIEAFERFDYVVVPSGSCGGTLRVHYPAMFEGDPDWHPRAQKLAARTYELVSFLVEIMGVTRVDAAYDGHATYHDACAGLRELGIKPQPRRLLASVRGLKLSELAHTEVCCGFGGTFCVKYPEISEHLVADKVSDAHATGADTLLAGDLGCLFNIAGLLRRRDIDIKCYHVAEILAGLNDTAPIARGEKTP